jgi:hypothetical protein
MQIRNLVMLLRADVSLRTAKDIQASVLDGRAVEVQTVPGLVPDAISHRQVASRLRTGDPAHVVDKHIRARPW